MRNAFARAEASTSDAGYAFLVSTAYALADVAALIGEPTRAAMLLALLDGQALPANELARAANLSASATSLHLAKLSQGGLLSVRQEGRHRYYRIASPAVACALEALGAVATRPPPPHSLSPERAALRAARTCYDHAAGVLAITLARKLEHARLLRATGDSSYRVTNGGSRWFAETMHIDVAMLAAERRPLARRCLDWTERKPHLAGSLGAAVLAWMLEQRWVVRTTGSRALQVTRRGAEGLERIAGVT
jgi:DNA-binding transcriptional ArsR family regulator